MQISRPLLSGWLILYWGAGRGSEGGCEGWCGFPMILGKVQVPPLGGMSALLGGWVDRHCPWAEAHCDTRRCCHFVQTCLALQFSHGHGQNVNVGWSSGTIPTLNLINLEGADRAVRVVRHQHGKHTIYAHTKSC